MSDRASRGGAEGETIGVAVAGGGWWPLWSYLAMFFGALVLLLPGASRYHGDERFYTDAALQMVESGDYWTPRYPDGQERFLKPIATYWAVVASWKVLGVHLMTARFPFLVAGCLILVLTAYLGWLVSGRREVAVLAALMMGSNYQVIVLSVRSTPDALLLLFVLISLIGFVRLLFLSERGFGVYLMAWLGAALAVETKGLLGLAPVVFVVAFRMVFRGRLRGAAPLVNGGAVALAAAVALGWYVVVMVQHGSTVLEQFFSDQVTAKTTFRPWMILGNLAAYAVGAVRHFLPWSLLVAAACWWEKRRVADAVRADRLRFLFLAGWFGMLAVVFSFGNMLRTRYVVAAYPMVAVAGGMILASCLAVPNVQRLVRVLLRTVSVLLLVGAVILAVPAVRFAPQLAGAVIGLSLFGVALGSLVRRGAGAHQAPAVACGPLVLIAVYELWVRPWLSPSSAGPMVEVLRRHYPGVTRVCVWGPSTGAYAAQLRVLSNGRLQVDRSTVEPAKLVTRGEGPVIVQTGPLDPWITAGYQLEPAAVVYAKWSAGDLARWWFGRLSVEVLEKQRRPVFLAWPPIRGPDEVLPVQGNAGSASVLRPGIGLDL